MAQAPKNRQSADTFRLGFGLDSIRSDLPLGGAASILVHSGILLAALLAWQTTPRIIPEDVIAVDMVSDTPSVKGQKSAPETAQTGVDTATPSPIPQTLPPSQSEATPILPAEPSPSRAAPAAKVSTPPLPTATVPAPKAKVTPAPTPPPRPTPTQPLPRPSALALPKPTTPAPAPIPRPAPRPVAPKAAPRPLPQPASPPPPKTAAQSSAKAAPKSAAKAPPAARARQPQSATKAPVEFDIAAASNAATGADSGGRRAPQLASRGQAGRLGKAGGGAQLTGDLEAALRSQIQPCWLEPANMSNAGGLLVVVSIDLGIDGRLLRDPTLVTPSSRAGASPSLVVAIDNALRAVRECAPFTLPPDRHETWRQVRFNFDPQRMARRQ